jgi:hypothetical protein
MWLAIVWRPSISYWTRCTKQSHSLSSFGRQIMEKITKALPKLIFIALFFIAFLLGVNHGERIAEKRHSDYISAQAAQEVKQVIQDQAVSTKTEIEYRDRIQKIYIKGAQIEKQIPVYVTSADSAQCIINAGFVRQYNAAWGNTPTDIASEFDREPAAISLTDIAEADSENATSCYAWREQALGLRALYLRLQEGGH